MKPTRSVRWLLGSIQGFDDAAHKGRDGLLSPNGVASLVCAVLRLQQVTFDKSHRSIGICVTLFGLSEAFEHHRDASSKGKERVLGGYRQDFDNASARRFAQPERGPWLVCQYFY